KYLRQVVAYGEGGGRGSEHLGIRRWQYADIFAVVLVEASVRSRPPAGLVSRGSASRRNTVPAGRSGFDPAPNVEEVAIENYAGRSRYLIAALAAKNFGCLARYAAIDATLSP